MNDAESSSEEDSSSVNSDLAEGNYRAAIVYFLEDHHHYGCSVAEVTDYLHKKGELLAEEAVKELLIKLRDWGFRVRSKEDRRFVGGPQTRLRWFAGGPKTRLLVRRDTPLPQITREGIQERRPHIREPTWEHTGMTYHGMVTVCEGDIVGAVLKRDRFGQHIALAPGVATADEFQRIAEHPDLEGTVSVLPSEEAVAFYLNL